MVTCIEIETASLVFACISLLSTTIAALVCIAMIIHTNILLAYLVSTAQRKVTEIGSIEIAVSNYGLYFNIGLAVALSIVIIALIFTIILIKGLISKKAHLVKAYFIYGVTANTLSALFALFACLTMNTQMGISLLGCFLYTIILIMIKATYLKLASNDYDQFDHKKLEA